MIEGALADLSLRIDLYEPNAAVRTLLRQEAPKRPTPYRRSSHAPLGAVRL